MNPDAKIILHGVSMGCATVCMMSGRDDLPENVKFTVADCGYTSAKDIIKKNKSTVLCLHIFLLLFIIINSLRAKRYYDLLLLEDT